MYFLKNTIEIVAILKLVYKQCNRIKYILRLAFARAHTDEMSLKPNKNLSNNIKNERYHNLKMEIPLKPMKNRVDSHTNTDQAKN